MKMLNHVYEPLLHKSVALCTSFVRIPAKYSLIESFAATVEIRHLGTLDAPKCFGFRNLPFQSANLHFQNAKCNSFRSPGYFADGALTPIREPLLFVEVWFFQMAPTRWIIRRDSAVDLQHIDSRGEAVRLLSADE